MITNLQLEVLLLGQDVSSISSSISPRKKIDFFFILKSGRIQLKHLIKVDAQRFVKMPALFLSRHLYCCCCCNTYFFFSFLLLLLLSFI